MHKAKRIKWTQKHLNYNWTGTLFTYETAFQLFRNTVEKHCWRYKGPRPTSSIPKDWTKIFCLGMIFINGKTSLFCVKILWMQNYVEILERHISEVNNLMVIYGSFNKIITLSIWATLLNHIFKHTPPCEKLSWRSGGKLIMENKFHFNEYPCCKLSDEILIIIVGTVVDWQ